MNPPSNYNNHLSPHSPDDDNNHRLRSPPQQPSSRLLRPMHPPPPVTSSSPSSTTRPNTTLSPPSFRRRRPDLTLPIAPREFSPLAVPLPLPPSATSTTHHNPPNFSDLERLTRVGSGAGGTVYKVLHRTTGKIYALKVIYGNLEDSVRLQIRREIEILRDVDNPNVVKCLDMYDHSGEIQVLLEFMDGGSLESKHISFEPSLAEVARQVLSGLLYLHKRRIVHRDIKPSNLLINNQKQVKIADFGVSRILSQTMDPCNSAVGTIAYMSPERINTDLNHGQYDGYAGDIWSLGVSILEFYLGRFPFSVGRQGDWAGLMCAICLAAPPEAPAESSYEFRNFIACCLQKEPGRRWTAAQLLNHPFILKNTGGGVGRREGVGHQNHHQHHQVQNQPPPTHQLLPPPLPRQSPNC